MNLVDKLIEQCKNPTGFVGSIMISIMNVVHTRMRKWALKKIVIKEDAVILDIGCGGGKTINTLSKIVKSGKVYGIDYSEKAVENSVRINRKNVENGKVIISIASVSYIPFQENFFDVVTAFQTHYFWPDLENDVKEVFRILKQRGHFMIVAEVYKINYHMKSYNSKEALQELFKKIGYINVQAYESNGLICMVGSK